MSHAFGVVVTESTYRREAAAGHDVVLPLAADALWDSIDAALTEFSTALPLHKSGKAHIVAIASTHRSALAPDIPTFEESGVKGFTAQSYIGIVAPAKTPPAAIRAAAK